MRFETMASVRKPSCTTYGELTEYRNTFTCMLCVETLSSPVTLSCSHSFCDDCLEAYVRLFRDKDSLSDPLPCPVCRKNTLELIQGIGSTSGFRSGQQSTSGARLPVPVRKESVASDAGQRCDACVYRCRVEEAEFYCGKCSMNLCSACKQSHDETQVFRGHTVIHVHNKDTFHLYCDTHTKLVCVYFCHECDRPACTVCLLLTHRSHRAVKLRDALAGRRDVIKTLLNDFGPRLERLEMKLRKISSQMQTTTGNGAATGNGSSVSGGGSQERIRKNGLRFSEPFLRSRSFTNGDGGNTCLNSGVSDGVEPRFRTADLSDVTEHIARNRKLYELSTKLIELSQSKKLLTVYQDVVSRLRTVIEVEFQRLNEILEDHLTRALMESSIRSPDPSKELLLDSGSSTSSSIRVRHSSGVSVNSAADPDSDSMSQSMLIRPKLIWKLEKQRSDVGEMWNPCGAAFINEDGGLIVAEYDVVNDRNNKLRIFTGEGRSHAVLAQGQIQPLGVAVTRDGHVAVTDCKGKRVKILTLNGQTVCEIGKGQFGWPYGIAANSRGNLVITDAFNDSVSVFQADGKRVRQFGSSGSQNTQFRNPYHVTVDAADNILVSDSGNNCVKAFDPSGRFLFTASDTGPRRSAPSMDQDSTALQPPPERKAKRRKLKGPRGLSVDLRGNLLVADDCSRVCMFDSTGKYVRNLLTEEDSVKYPEVVTCSPKGLLAVTEWNPANMYAVKVFRLYE